MGEYLSKGKQSTHLGIFSTDLYQNKVDHGWPPFSPTVAAPHSGGGLLLLATHNLARGKPLAFLVEFLISFFFSYQAEVMYYNVYLNKSGDWGVMPPLWSVQT